MAWAKSATPSRFGGVACNGIVTRNGSAYIAGHFSSPDLDLDGRTLINWGATDIFLAKYDALGNIAWAKAFSGRDDESASALATDELGNLYMTGSFYSGYLMFDTVRIDDPGSFQCTDLFVTKLDTFGRAIWAKPGYGAYNEQGDFLATDRFGGVYLTGQFASAELILDSVRLSITDRSSFDCFIAKIDDPYTLDAGSAILLSCITAAPNPFSDLLTISSDIPLDHATLILSDISGRSLKQIDGICGNSIVVAREQLPPGCYLMRLFNNGTLIATKKIAVKD